MSAADHTFPCLRCHAPVRVEAPEFADWLPVFAFWVLELDGLCKECLTKKEGRHDLVDDVRAWDRDDRRGADDETGEAEQADGFDLSAPLLENAEAGVRG